MKLIKDELLVKIPIVDNGEKLADLKKYTSLVKFSPGKYIKKEGKESIIESRYVREDVAKKLLLAQSFLPKGFIFVIRCGYRSLAIQKRIYERMYLKVKMKHPSRGPNQIREETSKMVAPPDIVPPHSTGGAIDLSVAGTDGKLLKMGTRLGQFDKKTETDSEYISKEEKKNRLILSKAMEKAGFVNYPTEWWHWSYGDRYWAAAKKKKYSIYKGI
jgi:zinc D-Ala-D-Ala dipeptidase